MIVKLEIFTWQGLSLGATHYYGSYHYDGNEIKIEYRMTEVQAKKSNKRARENLNFDEKYRAGYTMSGFDTKYGIIELAIIKWKELFTDAKLLVLGKEHFAPKLILDSIFEDDTEIKDEVKIIVDKYEAIGETRKGGRWYSNNEALQDKYSDEYNELISGYLEAHK